MTKKEEQRILELLQIKSVHTHRLSKTSKNSTLSERITLERSEAQGPTRSMKRTPRSTYHQRKNNTSASAQLQVGSLKQPQRSLKMCLLWSDPALMMS